MIVRTDAVVLRAFDYGETSRIVTLLTRPHGVMSVLARGARRPKSTFGSTLQPMACIQAVYFHRPNRGLQTLKEAAHLVRFPRLTADLERITLGLRLVEVARAVIEEGEEHPLALDLLVAALAHLDRADERPANALPWFHLRLAALLGFAPDIDREMVLLLDDDGGTLDLDTGAVLPRAISEEGVLAVGRGVRASRAALRAFAIFARTDLDTAGRLALDDATRRETETLVEGYLRTQTDAWLPERVQGVADQLDAGLRAAADAMQGK
jgi:DNA repair protein RecO (recombination protein O)